MSEEEKQCELTAIYRYSWPGKGESVCCHLHKNGIERVADAVGLFVEFIPLEGEKERCRSYSKKPLSLKKEIKFVDFLTLVIGLRDSQKKSYWVSTDQPEKQETYKIEEEFDKLLSEILIDKIKVVH